jgi:ArsR family transcriptional regulator
MREETERSMQSSLVSEVNELHSRLCGALADPKRILILYSLEEGPRNVTDISDALQVPQPTVSRHLKTLRERGLVQSTREAQSVYYSLTDRRVIDALDILRAVLADLLKGQQSLADTVSSILTENSNLPEVNE